MTKEKLDNDVKIMTERLLEIARSRTWNTISDECVYIISEIKDYKEEKITELNELRIRENEKKKPKALHKIAAELNNFYENLYVVNLYVYKSTPKLTIVEIQYYPKSSLNKDFFETVKDNSPMLHSKISIPPYTSDADSKFDINWELGGLRHKWKLFWWRQKSRREIYKRNKR